METVVSSLFFHVLEVYASLVNAHGSTGLHPPGAYAPSRNAFSETVNGWFSAPTAFHLFPAYVHQAVEKCSRAYHNALCAHLHAPNGADAYSLTVLYE